MLGIVHDTCYILSCFDIVVAVAARSFSWGRRLPPQPSNSIGKIRVPLKRKSAVCIRYPRSQGLTLVGRILLVETTMKLWNSRGIHTFTAACMESAPCYWSYSIIKKVLGSDPSLNTALDTAEVPECCHPAEAGDTYVPRLKIYLWSLLCASMSRGWRRWPYKRWVELLR